MNVFALTVSSHIHSEEIQAKKLPDFVDYDAYDTEVFKCAQTKPRPQTLTPGNNPWKRFDGGFEVDFTKVEKFLKKEKMVSKSGSIEINGKRDNVSVIGEYLRKISFYFMPLMYFKDH